MSLSSKLLEVMDSIDSGKLPKIKKVEVKSFIDKDNMEEVIEHAKEQPSLEEIQTEMVKEAIRDIKKENNDAPINPQLAKKWNVPVQERNGSRGSGFKFKIKGLHDDSESDHDVIREQKLTQNEIITKKQIFYDTEFIETQGTIDLISIGMVDHDGNTFYAISNEFNEESADQWVKENVIDKLPPDDEIERISNEEIGKRVLEFIGSDEVDLWAYYSAYDHVVLMWLYGKMISKPKQLPMFTNDLKFVKEMSGTLNDLQPPVNEHDALEDALWNKTLWEQLGSPVFPTSKEIKQQPKAEVKSESVVENQHERQIVSHNDYSESPFVKSFNNPKVNENIKINMSGFKLPSK